MKGVSFGGLTPAWADRVLDDRWVDQLRRLRDILQGITRTACQLLTIAIMSKQPVPTVSELAAPFTEAAMHECDPVLPVAPTVPSIPNATISGIACSPLVSSTVGVCLICQDMVRDITEDGGILCDECKSAIMQ